MTGKCDAMASQVSLGRYKYGTPGSGYTSSELTELPFARSRFVIGIELAFVYAVPPEVTFNAMLVRVTDVESDMSGSPKHRELS